ncbi:DUF3494 domain-containing protein [candidate division KSB1 bacterium]|nr:DUF3494 domain-containing protein [candidate division KSB1 bacterium]
MMKTYTINLAFIFARCTRLISVLLCVVGLMAILITPAVGVTISGVANNVWIFQIAQNQELGNSANVTLNGGAQASNIFWQVAGQVTLGTTAAMKGIILCQTTIVMSTRTILSGKALAQTAVTLDANNVTIPEALTAVENGLTPKDFVLSQNHPNPFNPVTIINYQLPIRSNVRLCIFDMVGREVNILVNELQAAGNYKIAWNAENFPSGVYIYRLNAGSFVSVNKMVYMK